jgi:hypothetical protein
MAEPLSGFNTSSLVPCRSCGKEINRRAKHCPHCGLRRYVVMDFINLAVVIVIAIVALNFYGLWR